MSKIICDICGTTYQDTADQCPICGCSREAAADLLGDDLLLEEVVETPKGKGGRFSSKKRKEIFDFDEVNAELEEEGIEEEANPYDEDEEYEEAPRHNTVLVILLTVLIAALLLAAGFLFVRYFLPNMGGEETVPTTVETTLAPTETTEETTQPTIPCQSMVMTNEKVANLNEPGHQFLLHILAMPEDTTDEIIYESADPSIATVSEDGKITAVAEGETIIYITCGNIQQTCKVVCDFTEETEPATEETTSETTDETTDETKGESSDGDDKSDVLLKLKQTDITILSPYSYQLELDCDLSVEDVEWSVEHSHIAKVENGYVTALKIGTTAVIAKYGDQEVQCIVRCG